MKKCLTLVFLILSIVALGQENQKENLRYYKIIQKKSLPKKGYHIVLKKVVSDSRCPEGVNCIWIGETELVVCLYNNKKFITQKKLTLSPTPKQNLKDIEWLAKYLPSSYKKIKTVEVVPYPKEGVKIDPKEYYILIGSEKSI